MALTRSFKETLAKRARSDKVFRRALLAEAAEALVAGDIAVGKALLRDLVNATVGFPALSADLGIGPKSLMRMLSPAGNPRADNLLAILSRLQALEGVELKIKIVA